MTVPVLFAGLDIESPAITAAAAVSGPDLRISPAVAASATHPALEHAGVDDPVAIAAAAEPLLSRFGRAAGVTAERVALAIPGAALESLSAVGALHWPEPVRIGADALEQARRQALRHLGRRGTVLVWRDRAAWLDGRRLVGELPAAWASSLRVEVEAWVVPDAAVAPAAAALDMLGVTLDLVMPRTLAAAEAVLGPGERARGALVVYLAPGQAEVAVFIDGGFHDLFTVPVRAGVADLAPLPAGERRAHLRREVAFRVIQLCTVIRRRLEEADLSWRLGGGALLVGPGATLPGVVPLAQRSLEMPARIGVPQRGVGARTRDPGAAAALGLVLAQARLRPLPSAAREAEAAWTPQAEDPEPARGGFGPAFGRWLREFVPSGSGV